MERQYHDKRPRKHALVPREHFFKKNGSWKPKMSFENEASANNWIRLHHWFLDRGYTSYRCSFCGKIHIGLDVKGEQSERKI